MSEYPTPPGPRMAYDVDGARAYGINTSTGVITEYANSDLAILNNESTAYPNKTGYRLQTNDYFYIAFPELRDIQGLFWAHAATSSSYYFKNVEVSSDTTSLTDGTWVSLGAFGVADSTAIVNPDYRTGIKPLTANNVRAVRFQAYGVNGLYMRAVHLYGDVSPGQELDRLALWHPTDDLSVNSLYFDWGDIPQGSQGTKQFRVKNLSSTKTASDVNLTKSSLSEVDLSIVSNHKFNVDGGASSDSVSVGSLAPGGISPVVTLSYNLLETTPLGLKTLRVHAKSTDWI